MQSLPRLAIQYQKYKAQSYSGYEYFLGPGGECDIEIGGALNRFGLEVGALRNKAEYSGRLGGDRRVGRATSATLGALVK